MEQELRGARRCVRTLDAIVVNALAGDLLALAKWRVAKRVRRVKVTTPRTVVEKVDPLQAA